jgi:predicted nucleotidyltransferase
MARAANEVEAVLKKFVQLVTEAVPVTKVVLYGSHAKGTAREMSDIDLVVISPAFGKHKLRDLRLLSEIALKCDDEIEALPYGTEDLQNLMPGCFLDEVLRTGRIVYPKIEE